MEVHHRFDHKEKRLFKHYLFDFLMLFLAVFSGFLAENLREHYVERKKEKQYIHSLLADLKSDTSSINKYIRKNILLMSGQDSLFKMMRSVKSTAVSEIYRLFDSYATWVYRARLTDRTMSQLKNAGGMRLIEKQVVSDSILGYDEMKRLLNDQGESYKRESDVLSDLSRKVLDYRFLLPFDTTGIPAKQNLDARSVFEFTNEIKIVHDQIDTYVVYLRDMFARASNLIDLIKKEYHLK